MNEKPEAGAEKGNGIVRRCGNPGIRPIVAGRWSMVLILSFFWAFPVTVLMNGALAAESSLSISRLSSAGKETAWAPVVSEEAFLEAVEPYLGTPYRLGGASRKGMDCSGFVRHIYSKTFSLDLPHSTAQQYALPMMEKVSKDELRTGDLIFFSQKNRRIAHVGIYLSDGKFIHAGRKSGVTISSLENRYWKVRMVAAKRPVGLWRPEDTETERSFSSIEIALNGTEGILKGAAREETAFSSLGSGLRPPSWRDISTVDPWTEGLTQTFELQLSHSLGKASWKMSLLQEGFFRYSSAEGDPMLTPQPQSPSSPHQYTLSGYRQGVKMAGDIDPFDWLRITPSLSYVGYERDGQESPCWGPGLGLSVQIKPLPSHWSFAADFQYWDEGSHIGGGFNDLDSWKSRNLSLMLGYDLSSDLRLRIVGQHGMGSLFKLKESPSDDEHKHNGFFFTLDWAF